MIDKQDKANLDKLAFWQKEEDGSNTFVVAMVNPSQEDMEMIFNLYRKYIDSSITEFKTGCNCQNSIEKIFYGLINWYRENFNEFL